jgi:preprotein translocase subunit SecG
MYIVITLIHVIACITLVLVVLLQAGKGADMGAVFGGASSTVFGSSGAGSFLTRLTTGAAIVFMLTSLALTYGSNRSTVNTIMPESSVAPQAVDEAPAAGAAANAPAGGDDEAQDVAGAAAGGDEAAAPAANAGGEAAGGGAEAKPAAPAPAEPAAP